ncbi:DUF4276 family protein [bacterium]|nr:DUF4276 family protein [bacterium]
MMRLYMFVEGQTEQTFADIALRPHLLQLGIHLQAAILIAHARKRGRVHRGGGRNYVAMKNDIMQLLKQEKAADVFFTTMIDLYAIHAEFPGLDKSQLITDPFTRVEYLEQCFADDIGDSRFLPYIQLHEYEAYLFSDVACFHSVGAKDQMIDDLQATANSKETPELIDDGQHTAPSKRIEKIFPEYRKTIDGPLLAAEIGLPVIRKKCAHFNRWLMKLEALAQTS